MADNNDFDVAVSLFMEEHLLCVRPADLEEFLELTRDAAMPAAQRLRQLAIALERLGARYRGWEYLQPIYRRAAELGPGDYTVFHSWGISALDWVDDWRRLEEARRVEIAAEAERAFLKALDLMPRDSHMAHSLGLLYYRHPLRKTEAASWDEKAIAWFGRAADEGPDRYSAVSQLYLAHCYHDRKDWPNAIRAYEKVDQATLSREWPAWRAVKCREQLAQCYAMSGQTEEAVRRFSTFLDEIESLDDKVAGDWVINLDELVEAVTHKLEEPTLLRRTQALAKRLGYEKRYKELFSREEPFRPSPTDD